MEFYEMVIDIYNQNIVLKKTIEEIFGCRAWMELKETSSITTWRSYAIRLIDAIEISIEESIEIKDDAWLSQIKVNLENGREYVKTAKTIDEVISNLSATLLRQVFLQIGNFPKRENDQLSSLKLVSLKKRENWRFNSYRSVLYIQSPKQVEKLFVDQQLKELGFAKHSELFRNFKLSKSKLSFSVWCNKQL
jgi:hypothetical protein